MFAITNVVAQDLPNSTPGDPVSPVLGDEPANAPDHCDDDNPGDCGSDATDVGSSPGGLQPSSWVGNPINLINGNKHQSEMDFTLTSSPLMFQRMYNSSATDSNVGLGMGWRHSYAVSILDAGDGTRQILQSNGARLYFSPDGTDEAGHPLMRAAQSNYGFLVQQDNLHQWHLPDGRTLKFQGSFLVEINWPDQRVLKLYYRAKRLESVTDEAGRTMVFAYTGGLGGGLGTYDESRFRTAPGQLNTITLPDGSVIGYDYDGKKNLSRVRYPDGTSREYHFEDETYTNHLTGLTDRSGVRFASWSYDEQGRAISSEHANGVEKVTLQYPDLNAVQNGEMVETIVTNSLDAQSIYTWQQPVSGIQAFILSSSGAGCASCPETGFTYQYDEQGRLSSATKTGQGTAVGSGSTNYRYDDKGRLAEIRRIDGAGVDHLIERREYEGLNPLPVRFYQPSVNPDEERVTEIERDEHGLPIRITKRAWTPWVPVPGESDYSTDPNAVTDFLPIERTVAMNYEQGRLVSIDGPRDDIEDITRLTWDNKNRLIAVARPSSPVKKLLQIDSLGRPTELRIGPASSYRIDYDDNGNITQIGHRGSVISFTYDGEGRTSSYTDAQGRVTKIVRDAVGRSIAIEDSFGRRSEIDWDSENRQTARSAFGVDGSLIRSVENSFTLAGQRESQTDTRVNAHGESSADTYLYTHDGNRLLSGIMHQQTGLSFDIDFADSLRSMAVSTPSGEATISRVDRLGQDAGRTDYRDNTTSYIRDDFGRRVGVHSPDTGIERLERNAAGSVVKRVREDSGVTRYSRDAAGRVLTRTHQNGDVTRYEYDNASGKLINISNSATTENFSYSKDGDLLVHHREIGARAFKTLYEYDERGRLTSKELPDGQTLRYRYHDSGANKGSVKAIARQRLFGQSQALVFDIDLERRDGAMGWTSHNGLQTQFAFSPNGQLVKVETAGMQSVDYQFDTRRKIVGIDKNGVKSKYQYRQGRLIGMDSPDQSRSYEYDALGNRRAQFVSNKTNDSLTGTEYEYAAKGEGNRLLKTRDMLSGLTHEWTYTAGGAPLDTGELSYRYDSERRPIEIMQGSSTIASYQYNGFGERISKTVYQQGSQPVITYFLYDDTVLSAEVEGSSDKLVQYLYLDRHRPVMQLNGDELNAIHTDNLGTPIAMSDSNASPVWAADYSPFGEATVTLSASALNLRLPGQYADGETQTHYNYFRDYDPAIGRYLTSDPIGLAGGDNSYAYALLDPLAKSDVFGLFSSGDSLSLEQMEGLNGNPAAIREWVRTELTDFDKRRDFYQWAHETMNGPDSARQTDWFLAASQVNASNALGQIDDLLPNALDIIEDETREYISEVGLGLAEQNVQTFLSLYFGESIPGIDIVPAPELEPGMCTGNGQQYGNFLDEALVNHEQQTLSNLTDAYFSGLPQPNGPGQLTPEEERDLVMNDIDGLLNFTGMAWFGQFSSLFSDPNTVMVVNHYWPDNDFDYNNIDDRILLGQSLVRINNGDPWR